MKFTLRFGIILVLGAAFGSAGPIVAIFTAVSPKMPRVALRTLPGRSTASRRS